MNSSTRDSKIVAAKLANPASKQPASPQPGRAITIALVAAAIVSLILLAFSWPSVTSEPKDLPIAAVGDQNQIDQITDSAPEGMLDVHWVGSRHEVGTTAVAQQLSIIGGIVGGVLTSMGIRSRRVRAVGTLVYGAVGGVALALIMQTWFGILQGNFGLNVLAIGLSIAATAGLINGFVSLIGPAGIAIGAVLTMFIGNPIASLNQPKEFLVGAWGDIGQFFVPGAAGTLLRDLSYFPDAAAGLQWWVLIAWFVVGIALIVIGHLLAHRRATTSAH